MTASLLAGFVGLAVGGLLNIVINRLSQEEPFWTGRPCCSCCQQALPWGNFWFLLSFAWHRGRCRQCGAPLPWRCPGVEAASALLAAALWWRFPGSELLGLYAFFSAALLVLTVLDLQHFWLPDVLTLPGTALGLICAVIFPGLSFWSALLGAFLGWAFFRGVAWAYEKVTKGRRQGVGAGDAKLMAFIGAVLGLKALPWVLFSSAALGSVAGLVVAWRNHEGRFTPIPYGPFLAVGALGFLFLRM
jgi:leader peptidase (prepilin peptidase) / N-methyltransferase